MLNNSLKFIASLLLSTTFILPGYAGNFEKIKEKGLISVAVYRDYLPFSYKEKGRIAGVDVDIAKNLGERLGFAVNVVPFTADETMDDDLRNMVWKGHYLGIGPADIMMHVPVDKLLAENNDRVTILAPYFNDHITVLYDRNKISQLTTLDVFREKKVGVELDSLSDHYLTSVFGGAFRSNVVHFMTAEEAVEGLKQGKIAAVMGPRTHLEGGLRGDSLDDYGITRPSLRGVSVTGWNVGVAIKAGEDQLIKLVDQTLNAMRKDGTVKKIFEKHGLTYYLPTE